MRGGADGSWPRREDTTRSRDRGSSAADAPYVIRRAAAIVAWAVQGPYYSTAFIAKGIEVALITLLAVDFARMDGNPVNVIKSELAFLATKLGRRPATSQAGA